MLTKRPVSTNEPLDLQVVKDRLNILHDDFDRDLDLLVRAAANAFETETGVAVMPADYEFRGDCWYGLALPRVPVRSVASVTYLDDLGAIQTVSTDNWIFDLTGGGAEIGFVSTWSPPWPLMIYRPGRIRVAFRAGYDDPETVGSDSAYTRPPEVDLAMLFLIGAWLDNREAVMAEQRYDVPNTFKYLASQFKVYR